MEGNKLIMFFDGAKMSEIEIMGKLEAAIKYKGSYYPEWNLPKFNEDWNLLMPVVDKIRDLGFRIEIDILSLGAGTDVHITRMGERVVNAAAYSKPIDAVFNACELFIQYYNSNKPVTQ